MDATGDHQTSRDKAFEIMIHKSTVEIDDRQMQGRRYARRRLPSSLRGSVNDIAASEDILGKIILYNTLSGNIFVYYIMLALYFFILFYLERIQVRLALFRAPGLV